MNRFLQNSRKGKNTWWRYVLSFLSIIVAFVIINLVIRSFIGDLRARFSGNDLAQDVIMYSLISFTFLFALLIFGIVSTKLHQRPFMTYINIEKTFNMKAFIVGFLIFGILIFISNLLTDYAKFELFLKDFKWKNFSLLFILSFISIAIQSFFEELVVRGYILQGLSLKIKKLIPLLVVNSLIFGIMHFGYGIESFTASFLFGLSLVWVVVLQNRIEYVTGAHLANNLVLSLFFIDINEATNKDFSWSFNFTEIGLHILLLLIFCTISFYLTKTNAFKESY